MIFKIIFVLVIIWLVFPEFFLFLLGILLIICETILRLFGKSFDDENEKTNKRKF